MQISSEKSKKPIWKIGNRDKRTDGQRWNRINVIPWSEALKTGETKSCREAKVLDQLLKLIWQWYIFAKTSVCHSILVTHFTENLFLVIRLYFHMRETIWIFDTCGLTTINFSTLSCMSQNGQTHFKNLKLLRGKATWVNLLFESTWVNTCRLPMIPNQISINKNF